MPQQYHQDDLFVPARRPTGAPALSPGARARRATEPDARTRNPSRCRGLPARTLAWCRALRNRREVPAYAGWVKFAVVNNGAACCAHRRQADPQSAVAGATPQDLHRRSDGTRWTNRQLLWHMAFG